MSSSNKIVKNIITKFSNKVEGGVNVYLACSGNCIDQAIDIHRKLSLEELEEYLECNLKLIEVMCQEYDELDCYEKNVRTMIYNGNKCLKILIDEKKKHAEYLKVMEEARKVREAKKAKEIEESKKVNVEGLKSNLELQTKLASKYANEVNVLKKDNASKDDTIAMLMRKVEMLTLKVAEKDDIIEELSIYKEMVEEETKVA